MLNHCPTYTTKKRLPIAITLAVGAMIAGIVGTSAVFAQQAETTTPPIQENVVINNLSEVVLTAMPPRLGDDGSIVVKPGEKTQVQVRVRNTSAQAMPIVTSVQDFILSEDGETPMPVTDSVSNRWSLASWLTLAPTESVIQPKQTVGINILIEVPEDALPGGRYAMILHTPNTQANTQESGESSSVVSQKVGTLLYLVVDGPINEDAFLRNLTFPKFSEYGPVPFTYEVENLSDIHIAPQTSIEIFNIFNQKVETIPVATKNVFPFTTRNFEGKWDTIWGFGPYTAKATMSFGSAGAIVIATTSFWLLPIKIVIAAGVLLLTLLILMLAVKRHLNHRRKQDEELISALQKKIESLGVDDHGSNTNSDKE